MIPPIDPSTAHHWNTSRQNTRSGDARSSPPFGRPPAKRAPHHERFEGALQEELTLWQVLLQPEPTPIPEKTGFAAAFEAAERAATYRIAFYQDHQPEQSEPARGNWWDTRA